MTVPGISNTSAANGEHAPIETPPRAPSPVHKFGTLAVVSCDEYNAFSI